MTAVLPFAQIRFQRRLELSGDASGSIHIRESVENLSHSDRPIAWTQHVTMGPPFLEAGRTQFRAPVARSKVIDEDFTGGRGLQKIGAEFNGLLCPRKDGGVIDLRVYPSEAVSGGFTTHLLDPASENAFFLRGLRPQRFSSGMSGARGFSLALPRKKTIFVLIHRGTVRR